MLLKLYNFSKRSLSGIFLGEKDGFFLNFFKTAKGGKLAAECVSNGTIS